MFIVFYLFAVAESLSEITLCTMVIYLNQKELLIQDSSSILELLTAQNISVGGVAVAINNQVVKRELWAERKLSEGDSVTIIVATFGG